MSVRLKIDNEHIRLVASRQSRRLPAMIAWRPSTLSRRNILSCLLLYSVTLLGAADTPWVNKQIAQWSQQDAWQILSDSPWVKRVTPAISDGLTAYQRRESGDLTAQGGGKGIGLEDFSLFGKRGAPAPRDGQGPERVPPGKLLVRWESALPIRAAEVRANEFDAPVLEGDDYAIAVYGLSLKTATADRKGLAAALKKTAMLQIEGRKDLKPSRVAALEMGGEMVTVIYLFPRSAALSLADKRIEFRAQIGRIFVSQYFFPELMLFQGKLAL